MAHPIIALACGHFGLLNHYIETFFITIQNMEMYLLTAYGLSQLFYTRDSSSPFQGLIQGNGAASPGFMLIKILLI